eukprot:Sspe_Gene.71356::Locus_42296_Transcript_1_1_Confidence_1.000_Length_482::g.71356::m.71356
MDGGGGPWGDGEYETPRCGTTLTGTQHRWCGTILCSIMQYCSCGVLGTLLEASSGWGGGGGRRLVQGEGYPPTTPADDGLEDTKKVEVRAQDKHPPQGEGGEGGKGRPFALYQPTPLVVSGIFTFSCWLVGRRRGGGG